MVAYLVHSCTNSILLYMFTHSVGYACLKDVFNGEEFDMWFQAQGKESLSSRIFNDIVKVMSCNNLVMIYVERHMFLLHSNDVESRMEERD